MNTHSKVFAACVLLGMLSACGNSADDPERVDPQSVPEDTVFDPLLNQRDHVKQQAESLPQERKARLDEAIGTDSR